MKIRGIWKEGYEEAPPEALDARIRLAAHRELRAQERFQKWDCLRGLWQPVLMAGAMGLAALLLAPAEEPAIELAEMMRERELLEALPVLRANELWEQIEKETARASSG